MVIVVLFFSSSMQINSQLITQSNLKNSETQINILLIFDNPYGAEYPYTKEILENRFGWNITTTALEKTIESCTETMADVSVDYTIDNLPGISNFDIISVMPGPEQENLMASNEVLSLIKNANQRGLIVSALCKGVRVLAAADVISGKNVTGHWDYENEYRDAGATYFDGSPPIIDGNIITCYSSTQYRTQMCCALATAVGVLEVDPPTILETQNSNLSDGNYSISANILDNSGVFSVEAKFYLLSEDGQRVSSYPEFTCFLEKRNDEGLYEKSIEIPQGFYSIDLVAEDIYYNRNIAKNIAEIFVSTSLNSTNSLEILIPIFGIFCGLIACTNKKKRK